MLIRYPHITAGVCEAMVVHVTGSVSREGRYIGVRVRELENVKIKQACHGISASRSVPFSLEDQQSVVVLYSCCSPGYRAFCSVSCSCWGGCC